MTYSARTIPFIEEGIAGTVPFIRGGVAGTEPHIDWICDPVFVGRSVRPLGFDCGSVALPPPSDLVAATDLGAPFDFTGETAMGAPSDLSASIFTGPDGAMETEAGAFLTTEAGDYLAFE